MVRPEEPDDDVFRTGPGFGRFMQDGASPSVIGGDSPEDDGMDETWAMGQYRGPRQAAPAQAPAPQPAPQPRYDREPPTAPIPVGSGERKSWLRRVFSPRQSR